MLGSVRKWCQGRKGVCVSWHAPLPRKPNHLCHDLCYRTAAAGEPVELAREKSRTHVPRTDPSNWIPAH